MQRISSAKSHSDVEMMASLIERNGLKLAPTSEAVYLGDCPFCGHEKTFTLWADKAIFRCFWCGCDGRFVISPERIGAELQKRRKMLGEMVG